MISNKNVTRIYFSSVRAPYQVFIAYLDFTNNACYKGRVGFMYRDADKSLARPGRKQATTTEDFEFHISYL
jgi:hypothetical protein